MIKKILISGLISLSIASSASAMDLKEGMNTLSGTLYEIQRGFLTNDKVLTQDSLTKFKKDIDSMLGDKQTITDLLPEDTKHKASIAINSAKMIDKSIADIQKVLADKNMRMINRQMKSQKAFLEIQKQCFRCHNLVRDWQ